VEEGFSWACISYKRWGGVLAMRATVLKDVREMETQT